MTFDNILLVGAEVQSTAMDLSTRGRDVAVIFGDGAGAAIISKTNDDKGILSSHLHSEGKYAKELWLETPSSKLNPRLSDDLIKDGSHFLKMNGREVFKNAVRRFPEVILEALNSNNLDVNDIDLLIYEV